MRTLTRTKLPTEPIESALGTARDAALTVKTKGLELLDTDAAHELLHRGQHVAVVARTRGVELLDSDTAHELRRRGRNVVAAAKGDVVVMPKRSRRSIGMLLFAAGAAAGVVAAIVSKRMSTSVPPISSYDDPAVQFPTKDGVIDLTSLAAEEGVTDTPVREMADMGDVEIGSTASSTSAPLATSGTSAGTSAPTTSNGSSSSRGTRSAKPRTEGTGTTS